MKLLETEEYEDLGAEFQYQWISLLKDSMKKHGITDETAKEICGDFTFDLSMLLDQGEIAYSGATYRPVIAFTPDEESFLIQNPDFEYHEYAYGNTSEVFDGK